MKKKKEKREVELRVDERSCNASLSESLSEVKENGKTLINMIQDLRKNSKLCPFRTKKVKRLSEVLNGN